MACFITYSPTIDQSDLKSFIINRFNVKSLEYESFIKFDGVSYVYAVCISKFLIKVFKNASQKLSSYFSELSLNTNINPTSCLISEEFIKYVYHTLINTKISEDTIILNLMYH